jgi:RHS repeat-associated protein
MMIDSSRDKLRSTCPGYQNYRRVGYGQRRLARSPSSPGETAMRIRYIALMATLAASLHSAPTASACSLNPTAVISAPAASSSHIHGTGVGFVGTSSTANCGWISAYIWKNGVTVLSYSSSFSYNVTLEPEQVDSVITVSLQVINSYGRSHTVYRTITIKRDHQSQYFVKDHLGSPRVVVDGKGAVLSHTDYYPFGMVMPGRAGNISLTNDRVKFTGYLLEEEGGQDLYHAGARSYDPIIGRFTSQDRFKSKYHGLSPYQYAGLNPNIFIDANGDSLVSVKLIGLSSSNPTKELRTYFVEKKIAESMVGFVNRAIDTYPQLSVNNIFRENASSEINTTNTKAKGISRHQAGFAIDLNGVGSLSSDELSNLNTIASEYGFKPLPNQANDLPHFSANPTDHGYHSLQSAYDENQNHYKSLTNQNSVNNEVVKLIQNLWNASPDKTRVVYEKN